MKRIISIVVSLTILAVIYWKIDFAAMGPVFRNCHPLWMIASLAMVLPLTFFTAWRLRQLMPRREMLGIGEANKLILAASVLNLVLPSKMGDLAKAFFMQKRGHLTGSLALALVVFEKSCDMLSLLWWCVFGLVWVKWTGARALTGFHPPEWLNNLGLSSESLFFWLAALVVGGALGFGTLLIGSRGFAAWFFGMAGRFAPGRIGRKVGGLAESWNEMHGYFWADKGKLFRVAASSLFIWFLHLLQIWMFILALRASAPFLANLALSPLAILAGLLPLTFAGVGTRDAALVIFYAPYFAAPTAAALGILCTARYLLPAIGGAPFLPQYLGELTRIKKARAAVAAAN